MHRAFSDWSLRGNLSIVELAHFRKRHGQTAGNPEGLPAVFNHPQAVKLASEGCFLEVEANVGEDAVGLNVVTPSTGVGHANRGMLGNLARDAETDIELILEFVAFDFGATSQGRP